MRPPRIASRQPSPSPVAETRSSSATPAMLGKASPRKPRLRTALSPSTGYLLVACRWQASQRSGARMPQPSSPTRINVSPPPRMSMRIERAPASSAFSTNSFTTEPGRSIVSPAAMPAATLVGSTRMVPVGRPPSRAYSPSPPANTGGIAKEPLLKMESNSTGCIRALPAAVLPDSHDANAQDNTARRTTTRQAANDNTSLSPAEPRMVSVRWTRIESPGFRPGSRLPNARSAKVTSPSCGSGSRRLSWRNGRCCPPTGRPHHNSLQCTTRGRRSPHRHRSNRRHPDSRRPTD